MKILNRNYAIHTLFESFTKRIQGKCEEQLPEKPLGRLSAFVSVCRPSVVLQTADRFLVADSWPILCDVSVRRR